MGDIIVFIASGISTFLLLWCRRKKYNMSWKDIITILVVVGIIGYCGAIFGSWLSYGSWKGIRFYSKALFVTITLLGIAKVLNKEPTMMMDYYGPIDILALVVMKVNCYRTGCCAGITLYENELGERISFPSQIAELLVAITIFLLVIVLEKKEKCDGYRYYLYLLIYGSTRFIFDYLRVTPSNRFYIFDVSITVTQVICICLTIIGIVGVYSVNRRKINKIDEEQ